LPPFCPPGNHHGYRYQLVRDAGPGHGAVRVLNTARRAGSRLTGPDEVRARHGVTPAQIPDYRALAGDAPK
jgi:5'-3' exonuclease